MKSNYLYFVEGECEKALIETLIQSFGILPPRKIKVLNICQKTFPPSLIFTLKPKTCIVFVFDTDAGNPDYVRETVKQISKSTTSVEIIVIPQCRNLEDELKRACHIREIRELTGSKTNSDFKRDFLKASNLEKRLKTCHFDFSRLWIEMAPPQWETLRRGDIRKHCRKI